MSDASEKGAGSEDDPRDWYVVWDARTDSRAGRRTLETARSAAQDLARVHPGHLVHVLRYLDEAAVECWCVTEFGDLKQLPDGYAEYATLPDQAVKESYKEIFASRDRRVWRITPTRWPEIQRDSFVFGQVAAEAYAAHPNVSMTRSGFVLEGDVVECTDDDMARIGRRLDAAADRALAQRAALEVLRPLIRPAAAPLAPSGSAPRRYVVCNGLGNDLGCYESWDAANKEASEQVWLSKTRGVNVSTILDGATRRILARWERSDDVVRVELEPDQLNPELP